MQIYLLFISREFQWIKIKATQNFLLASHLDKRRRQKYFQGGLSTCSSEHLFALFGEMRIVVDLG